MYQDGVGTALQNIHHVILGNLRLTFHDDLITLDRYNLTGILVYEVFVPTLQHTGGQLRTYDILQCLFVDLHLFCKIENLQDVLIGLETDSTQQGGHWQLLLTVDICVHDIVDVSSKLYPATFERNNTGTVEQRTIGMYALSKEYAGRTVQLRNNHTLSTVDDERTICRHIRNRAQEHILH